MMNMKYYYEFIYPESSNTGFNGYPTIMTKVLGGAVISFDELDEQLSTAIAFLLRRGDIVGLIVTYELSLRVKINLFVLLLNHEAPDTIVFVKSVNS